MARQAGIGNQALEAPATIVRFNLFGS